MVYHHYVGSELSIQNASSTVLKLTYAHASMGFPSKDHCIFACNFISYQYWINELETNL